MPRSSTTWRAGVPRPVSQQNKTGRKRWKVGVRMSLDEAKACLTLFGSTGNAIKHLGLNHPLDRCPPGYVYKTLRCNMHDPAPTHAVMTVAMRWRAWVAAFLRNPWEDVDPDKHSAWERGVCYAAGADLPFTLPVVPVVDSRPTKIAAMDAVMTAEDVFFPTSLFPTMPAVGTRLGLGWTWFHGKKPGRPMSLVARQQFEERWQLWADTFLVFPNRREDWWHPDLREKDGSISKFHADEQPFTWPAHAPREPFSEEETRRFVHEHRVDPEMDSPTEEGRLAP